MGIFNFVKAGGKKFGSIVGTGPKVNKTKLDTAKTNLAIGKQKLQGSTAKLKQTQFEIKNKLPLTFGKSNKKTLSNTEKAKLRNDESKKAFKAWLKVKQKDLVSHLKTLTKVAELVKNLVVEPGSWVSKC